MKGRRITIIGGTGIVGAHTAFRLAHEGWSVRLPFRSQKSRENVAQVFARYAEGPDLLERLEFIPLAHTDVSALTDILLGSEAVVHAAARVSLAGHGRRAAEELIHHNVDLTTSVVEASLLAKLPCLIHVGSIATLGVADAQGLIPEDSTANAPHHLSEYARSKTEAEREVLRGAMEGLKVHIVNPAVILAPITRAGSSSELIEWAMRGGRFYPTGTLAWVDVRAVAWAIAQLAAAPPGAPGLGERITLISGSTPYRDFLTAFARAAGNQAPVWPLSHGLARAAYPLIALLRTLRLLPPSISRETVAAGFSRKEYAQRARPPLSIPRFDLKDTVNFVTGESTVSP